MAKPRPLDLPARRGGRRALLAWYDANHRDLPWRSRKAGRSPYRIWVSEIMLQQTRVAAVLGHYRAWMKRFPSLRTLAQARLEDVLAAWSGLGYYRRARMLHRAACVLVENRAGRLPNTAAGLRRLPGIGRYTAAAIASIAFGEPVAVVDGNVERVLGRLLGKTLTGKDKWEAAQGMLEEEHPGDWNQAVMELGAVVCTPREPACAQCPMRPWCATWGEGRRGRGTRQRRETVYHALAVRAGRVYLVQRPDDARKMAGMWELPQCQPGAEELLRVRHSITDTQYDVRVLKTPPKGLRGGKWFAPDSLHHTALTGLARKVLRRLGVM